MIVETAKVKKLRSKRAELAKVDEEILQCVAANGLSDADSNRFARLCKRREALFEEIGDLCVEVYEESVRSRAKYFSDLWAHPNPTSNQWRQIAKRVHRDSCFWARRDLKDAGLLPPGRNEIMDLAIDVKEGRIEPPSGRRIRDMKTARAQHERHMQLLKRHATLAREVKAA